MLGEGRFEIGGQLWHSLGTVNRPGAAEILSLERRGRLRRSNWRTLAGPAARTLRGAPSERLETSDGQTREAGMESALDLTGHAHPVGATLNGPSLPALAQGGVRLCSVVTVTEKALGSQRSETESAASTIGDRPAPRCIQYHLAMRHRGAVDYPANRAVEFSQPVVGIESRHDE